MPSELLKGLEVILKETINSLLPCSGNGVILKAFNVEQKVRWLVQDLLKFMTIKLQGDVKAYYIEMENGIPHGMTKV